MKNVARSVLFFSMVFCCFFTVRHAFGQVLLTETMAGVITGAGDMVRVGEPASEAVIRKRLEIMGYKDVGSLNRPSPESPIITKATNHEGQIGELMIEPIMGNVISFMPE